MLLFQNFAENTMNELLGWYGYDKVELKDGEDIEFRSYTTDGESRQHISVLKGKDVRLMALLKQRGRTFSTCHNRVVVGLFVLCTQPV